MAAIAANQTRAATRREARASGKSSETTTSGSGLRGNMNRFVPQAGQAATCGCFSR